jgi:predicted peptidase
VSKKVEKDKFFYFIWTGSNLCLVNLYLLIGRRKADSRQKKFLSRRLLAACMVKISYPFLVHFYQNKQSVLTLLKMKTVTPIFGLKIAKARKGKKMNKFLKAAAATALVLSLAACSSASDDTSSDASTALSGTYSINVTGDDWGAGVDKAIVELSEEVEGVSADTFTVSEYKQNTDWTDESYPVIEDTYTRTVLDAYTSDAEGNKVDGASNYVTIEMYISPDEGSPFLYTMSTGFNTWSDPYQLTISLAEGQTITADGEEVSELSVSGDPTAMTTNADMFVADSYDSTDGFTIDYGTYVPDGGSDTLFVWLHGGGEGGADEVDNTDYLIPILANEVTAFAGDEFQETLGGANVLVPQSPTYWLDTIGDASDVDTVLTDGRTTSAYTESLHELIAKVKEETGSEKVVIAGCSNGGFMTQVLALNYGDEYDAYVPICEPYLAESLTDDDIDKLASLPMYYIWSDADTTVDPTIFEVPTLERILATGTDSVKMATTEKVVDTTGRFTDENGDPYEYAGHWSWITFDNNEAVTEDGVSAWQWIADQINK